MDRLHPSITAAAEAVKQYLQADETLPNLIAPVQIRWIVGRDALPLWVQTHWPDVSLQTHQFYDPPSIKVFATWRRKRFLLALMKPAHVNTSRRINNEEE